MIKYNELPVCLKRAISEISMKLICTLEANGIPDDYVYSGNPIETDFTLENNLSLELVQVMDGKPITYKTADDLCTYAAYEAGDVYEHMDVLRKLVELDRDTETKV